MFLRSYGLYIGVRPVVTAMFLAGMQRWGFGTFGPKMENDFNKTYLDHMSRNLGYNELEDITHDRTGINC